MKYFKGLLLSILLILFSQSGKAYPEQQEPIKIACIGNSITYGAGVANREKNAFPAQLQAMLGDGYDVGNFGVSGTTLLKEGDRPYWNTDAYKEARDFDPDIVFIKLGTNDSKIQNRVHLDRFEEDYVDLIMSFKSRNLAARIVLLLPVPSFNTDPTTQDSTKIWGPVIKNKILPKTQNVAYNTQSEVIDLYQLFIDRPGLLPDRVHPSSLGATIIAKRLYEMVTQKGDDAYDFFSNAGVSPYESENFQGFELFNFELNQIKCKVVIPKKAASGHPWVLRARFWGHEPQTDVALLERGFHIAYCDVSDLYGGNEAVQRWNDFYKLMTAAGLSKKVALEGMSRGGLIIYNWAVENSEKVACIYADAPVLDGTSWPGGLMDGKGSAPDWERFKAVYKIQSEAEIANFKGNPIHKTKEIAQAGFPMLHVVGETDKVVPIAENTTPFAKAVQQHGGNIKIISKPDNDHHPHSLKNPTPIVHFILNATNQKLNFATIPAPSAEYRSGAGWPKETDWWTQANDIDSICRSSENIGLLLIGNSITQGFGNRPNITVSPGKNANEKFFQGLKWINAGISGDRTQQVLYRIVNGKYESTTPHTVVLTIGVNNFSDGDSAAEISEGITRIVDVITKKFIADTEILLFGPLPTGVDPASEERIKYNEIHQRIRPLGERRNVSYHNVLPQFVTEEGFLNPLYYSEDGIHLKAKGYDIWAAYIKEQLGKD